MKQDREAFLDNIRKRFSRSSFCLMILVLADITALVGAVVAAHILRYNTLPWQVNGGAYLRNNLLSLSIALAVYIVSFWSFRLYKCAWRFAGLEMLGGVIFANTIGLLSMVVAQLALGEDTFQWSIYVIMWAASIVFVGGMRIILRVMSITQHNFPSRYYSWMNKSSSKRAVIIGAGECGARTLKGVRHDPSLNYEIVGFLDDDSQKHGTYIGGVKVIGRAGLVLELIDKGAIDEVIVAIQEVSRNGIHGLVMECRRRQIPVKVIPYIRDVLNDSISALENSHRHSNTLADLSLEDLLRRKPVDTTVADIGGYITGARVLVTGAGGSIGSELCRQIASMNPASLVLLGHGENSIHNIAQELSNSYSKMKDRIHCAIASTANQHRIEQVFRNHRPEVVFHAAAHKHVPIMESNEQEAVSNNVIGTYNIAAACGEHSAERVVLISTDKAADPCCVMGATKWLCEEVFRSAASLWPGTSYMAVRFGNVLGSRGSVVPLFHDQIRRGGPVLVTHPDMTRYFMTIPEAVRLVLEAGAVGKSGELYLLDMGKPVKILDLATDMIRLCGLQPDKDIQIEYSGIRPGEKMHENLTSETETIEKTAWEGLSLVKRPDNFSQNEILDAIAALRDAVTSGGDAHVRRILYSLMPPQCAVENHEEFNKSEASEKRHRVGHA